MGEIVEVFIGDQIEITSERTFLEELRSDLLKQKEHSVIFANFFTKKKPLQIDFLVITTRCACHIELKNWTAPVKGDLNGPWQIMRPNGSWETLGSKNPYKQTLDSKYEISNEMEALTKDDNNVPKNFSGKPFFTSIESVLCVFPELQKGSIVPSDYKVSVKGYKELIKFLTSQQKNPGWSQEHWIKFAMRLNLVRQKPEDIIAGPTILNAKRITDDYVRRFTEFEKLELKPLIPTTLNIDGAKAKSNTILDIMAENQHLQFVGPSGCGKTHLAKHMMLRAIEKGCLPVYVRAGDYRGDLNWLFDKSVAHLYPDSSTALFRAAKLSGQKVILVIDGFNECAPNRRQEFIKDIQAIYLKWQLPILLNSQSQIELPEALRGRVFLFENPDINEKTEILNFYSSSQATKEQKELIEAFETPFEVQILAESTTGVGANTTSTDILQSYTRERCADTENPIATYRILCELASFMQNELTTSLTINEGMRYGEKVADRIDCGPNELDEAIKCRLLQTDRGFWRFRHEIFQRFLAAYNISRKETTPEKLAFELSKPQNQNLAEFILTLQPETEIVRQILSRLNHVSLTVHAMSNKFGTKVRDILLRDAKKFLKRAEEELENVQIEVKEKEGWPDVQYQGTGPWSQYEQLIFSAIGRCLASGLFLDDVMRTIGETDKIIRRYWRQCRETKGRLTIGDKSGVFASTYIMMKLDTKECLPVSLIINNCHDVFGCVKDQEIINRIVNWNFNELTEGQFYLTCLLLRHGACPGGIGVAKLLSDCWVTGIYHLRLEALWVAEHHASSAQGEALEEIKEVLSSLQTTNPFLSTTLIETMNAYEMVESPVGDNEVAKEIREILKNPDSPEARERAHGIVCNIFEDVFQGTFYRVIDELEDNEKVILYTMAALGAPSYGLFTDFCLRELLRFNNPYSLKAFERWASKPPGESPFMQDETSCFLYGHCGCEKYREEPLVMSNIDTDDKRAWQIYGEIFFWLSKTGLSQAQVEEKCKPLWKHLREHLVFEAVDPLMHISKAFSKDEKEYAFVNKFFAIFIDQIREILEYGLGHLNQLSSIIGGEKNWLEKDRAKFVISALGEVGTKETIRLLKPYLEKEDVGLIAAEAIRNLNAKFGG